MRVTLMLLGLSASFLSWASCGDDSSDPNVVEVSELLGPGEMKITDEGDGSVTLYWNSSNPEDDFEGYNIYGGKISPDELEGYGVSEGASLQLLSQTGEPSEVAKSLLQAMDYNLANEKALPNAPEKKIEVDEDAKFNFLPIHIQDGEGKPLVPTCQPETSTSADAINCAAIASADSRKDSDNVKSYGTNKFTVSGLTAGESYCFIVFSVQDEGEEISQSSSTVECVTPKVKSSAITLNVASSKNKGFDLEGYAANCEQTCPEELSLTDRGNTISADDTDEAASNALHFEAYSGSEVYIVGSKHVAIKDVGYFSSLDQVPDDLAPVSFPASYSPTDAEKNPLVGGNYTRPFASVVLKHNHVYLVAVGDKEGDYPSTFTYHWLHVAAASGVQAGNDFQVTLFVNKTSGAM